MKQYFAIILLLLTFKSVFSQEKLIPLSQNPILKGVDKIRTTERVVALELPFFDDFYPLDIYPNVELWEDNLVFVNATFPVSPPTIGVATFDGLNANGDPYSIVADDYGIADLLTSLPINLQGLINEDDVYLSFFWQPKGLGDAPDFDGSDNKNKDYLIVEFLDSLNIWDTMWIQPGDTLLPFNQEFIKIENDFLHDNFQFRFKSVGRLTGAIDHWHVDYVKVDKFRNPDVEANIPELAYQYLPSSLIEPYYVMPYIQFDSSYLADSHSVYIRNNFTQATTDIIDFYIATELSTMNVLDNFAGPSDDILPLLDLQRDYEVFQIPTDIQEDTVTVRVEYSFEVSAEDTANLISARNNKVVKDQVFSNYFAYDDGSAERAYILEVKRNDALYGRVALKYNAAVVDTLRAVKINFSNFNQVLDDVRFSMYVWKTLENDTTQEEVLYEERDIRISDLPVGDLSSTLNTFTYVPMRQEHIISGANELIIAGDFYIGFEIDIDVVLPIGWDQNSDGSDFQYYNLGIGWFPTQFDGALMMNPVLGKELPEEFVVDVSESVLNQVEFQIYPNPVHKNIQIKSEISKGYVEIIDMLGRKIIQTEWNQNEKLNVESLTSGIYLLRITNVESGKTGCSQFAKQ